MRVPSCIPTLGLVVAFGLSGSLLAHADTVEIPASKDNTLYENATGSLSNGAGPHLLAGRIGAVFGGLVRRAVIHFDVAGSGLIPPGASIEGVSLTLSLNNSSNICATLGDRVHTLHRLLADWGEGSSNSGDLLAGQGAAATPGDATWQHTFFDTGFWTNDGGDFDATVHATAAVGCCPALLPCALPQTWTSAQMAADVQSWLDQPSSNFGWLLLGDESVVNTGRRFDSREGTSGPSLSVTFSSGCTDTDGDTICDDGDGNGSSESVRCSCQPLDPPSCNLDCDDNCQFTMNADQLDQGALLSAAPDGIGDACQCGDVDDTGQVTADDVLVLRTFLADPNQPLSAAGISKCTVRGTTGECDILQLTVLRRAVEGPTFAPGLSQTCTAAAGGL